MNIYVTTLCFCLATHAVLAANVVSVFGPLTEEERLDKDLNDVTIEVTSKKPIIDSSSSEESSSSESSEESHSKEQIYRRIIKKRSLESQQDPINTIGEGTRDTITKTSSELEKDTTSDTVDRTANNSESTLLTNKNESELTKTTLSPPTSEEAEVSSPTVSDFEPEADVEEKPTTETEVSETDPESEPEKDTDSTSNALEETPTSETEVSENDSQSETEKGTESTSDALIENLQETTTETELTSTTTTEESEDSNPVLENNENVKDEDSSSGSSSQTSIQNTTATAEEDPEEGMMARVNKLSDQIRQVLINYRKVGAVQLPGQSFFPEPMVMQDFTKYFSVGRMTFKNMKVYGLSNFTVEHINTDVDSMQVYILLHMKRLVITGNYTLSTLISKAAGPFNVTLLEVDSEGTAEIQAAPEGHLEATDSVLDMFTSDMIADFKNLGFMAAAMSTVGDAVFNSMKPQILDRVNVVIRKDVNEKLKEFSTKFINKVNPVVLAFSEARRYVRTNGYDPYNIKDHTFLIGGLVFVNITDFWVEGLSRFHRAGNLSLFMDKGVLQVGVHVVTQQLSGRLAWSGETFGITKYGKTNFTVDHLQVRALVNQSLDVTKKPVLHDLDLELGYVKVKMDSQMPITLMIEGIINAVPKLIRHIIVDTLEDPLKEKIQEILDEINVEEVVDENLPRLDNYGL